MNVITSSGLPLMALAFPLTCAFLIYVFRHRPNLREGFTLTAALGQFAVVISMAPLILDNRIIVCRLITIADGLDIVFRVDAFGLIFAITSSFLWVLVSLYSIGYM
ncbi:MAG: monovalent cation/H+ antiporter subunit D family protein, partial [Anderseniella sp.]